MPSFDRGRFKECVHKRRIYEDHLQQNESTHGNKGVFVAEEAFAEARTLDLAAVKR